MSNLSGTNLSSERTEVSYLCIVVVAVYLAAIVPSLLADSKSVTILLEAMSFVPRECTSDEVAVQWQEPVLSSSELKIDSAL